MFEQQLVSLVRGIKINRAFSSSRLRKQEHNWDVLICPQYPGDNSSPNLVVGSQFQGIGCTRSAAPARPLSGKYRASLDDVNTRSGAFKL